MSKISPELQRNPDQRAIGMVVQDTHGLSPLPHPEEDEIELTSIQKRLTTVMTQRLTGTDAPRIDHYGSPLHRNLVGPLDRYFTRVIAIDDGTKQITLNVTSVEGKPQYDIMTARWVDTNSQTQGLAILDWEAQLPRFRSNHLDSDSEDGKRAGPWEARFKDWEESGGVTSVMTRQRPMTDEELAALASSIETGQVSTERTSKAEEFIVNNWSNRTKTVQHPEE